MLYLHNVSDKKLYPFQSHYWWSVFRYHPYPGLNKEAPSSNGYKEGFATSLCRKDLGLAVDCANQTEVALPLTFALHQIYSLMVRQGHGSKDFSFLLPFLKKAWCIVWLFYGWIAVFTFLWLVFVYQEISLSMDWMFSILPPGLDSAMTLFPAQNVGTRAAFWSSDYPESSWLVITACILYKTFLFSLAWSIR